MFSFKIERLFGIPLESKYTFSFIFELNVYHVRAIIEYEVMCVYNVIILYIYYVIIITVSCMNK